MPDALRDAGGRRVERWPPCGAAGAACRRARPADWYGCCTHDDPGSHTEGGIDEGSTYDSSAAFLATACWMVVVSGASTQAETYVATATTATGVTVEVPVTIVVTRKMPQGGREDAAAFRSGGRPRCEIAQGVAAAGSLQVGTNTPMPIRVALERAIEGGV